MTIIKKILFICSFIAAVFTQVSAQLQDTTYSFYSFDQATNQPIITTVTVLNNQRTTVEKYVTDSSEVISITKLKYQDILAYTSTDYREMVIRREVIDRLFKEADNIGAQVGQSLLDTTGLTDFIVSNFTLKGPVLSGEVVFKMNNKGNIIGAIGKEKITVYYTPVFLRLKRGNDVVDLVPVVDKDRRKVWASLDGHRLIQTAAARR